MSNERRCPHCGELFADDAYFCGHDGHGLLPPDLRGELAGRVLGERYYLEGLIGSGGLGQVYRARHIQLGRVFAVKMLAGAATQDPSFVRRFEREAKVLSRLRHAYCVEVIDFGSSAGHPYLVMELLEGRPLSEYTRGSGMPLRRALDLLIKLLSALSHAHQLGVIHRDLKPDNIMLVPSPDTVGGELPKILDFGLASLNPGIYGSEAEALTAPGTVIGTPSYLAPERVTGDPIDHRVDLYAMGVIAYELCCGRKPFLGDGNRALIQQHLLEPPPAPRELRPSLPDVLDRTLQKALAKNPDDRFRSADELRARLEALLPLEPSLAAESPPTAVRATAAKAPK